MTIDIRLLEYWYHCHRSRRSQSPMERKESVNRLRVMTQEQPRERFRFIDLGVKVVLKEPGDGRPKKS